MGLGKAGLCCAVVLFLQLSLEMSFKQHLRFPMGQCICRTSLGLEPDVRQSLSCS